MSRRSSDETPFEVRRKPEPDLYTMMLFVAFLALTVGTVLLFLLSREYGDTPHGAPSVQSGAVLPQGRASLAGDDFLFAKHLG